MLLQAQKNDEFKKPRILILLDGSSSMLSDWQIGESRFKVANKIVLALMDSIYKTNKEVEFSLRVYGHQSPVPDNNCTDTRNEVMFTKDNKAQMELRLASLKPKGVSPIAYSLKTAAESDFVNERDYAYSLVLITDGGESCGGNICDVVKTLLDKKIQFKPYIVSLVDYAPLIDQYSCLGTYLQISKPEDIAIAINTIAGAYKELLAIPILKPKLNEPAIVPISVVDNLKVPPIVIPVEIEEHVEAAKMKFNSMQPMSKTQPKFVFRKRAIPILLFPVLEIPEPEFISSISQRKIISLEQPKPVVPKLIKHENVMVNTVIDQVPEPENIASLRLKKVKPSFESAALVSLSKSRAIPSLKYTIAVDTEIVLPKVQMEKIPYRYSTKLFSVYWTMGNPNKWTRIPALKIPPREKVDTVRTIVTYKTPDIPTPPKMVFKPQPGGVRIAQDISKEDKPTEFTITKELSKETTLQVYFTNGKGKFFQTSPRLLLVDPKTKETVFKFFRTVDANGNPDLVNVPPGNYDLRFESNTSLVSQGVSITKDNNQKLVIIVHNSGLQFRYENNERRPVKEYTATVKRLFDNAHALEQPCDKIFEYEPGNYHIEIPGTLPRKRFNLDIDFDRIFTVDIAEDGIAQFNAVSPLGKVFLYYQDGDRMEYFYTFNMNSIPDGQNLHLQPGPYEARTKTGAFPFFIKSNSTTEIELK